ncbi:FkbM family methyltransferase [Mucilaginibacter pedocola]|uniref:Methyltransferase FkbM domain-containing protein n=1 Tax=Mucilaginibacter pedocola TaxID=1792845 RepID=A0A1S9PJ90_9SPHI|nr:FkbM family methyltransferase [Mucilaginibacter pedocola]OOQ61022.1 hypothetical protein BC343_21460 [Mucilaginibacter pedocola]
MNLSLLYKPLRLVERVALEIKRNRRFKKLKGTPAATLGLGHIDSMELLEIVRDNAAPTLRFNIFDVGSNVGTWTLLAKAIFPNARIDAFEPLQDQNLQFEENCKRLDNIYLHKFCLGSEEAAGIINVSSYPDSSSLLEATPLEFEHFKIKKESELSVEVKRLSGLIDNSTVPLPDLIKLDVQGFELEVLKGLGEYLNSISYVICEVSFKEYYYGQPQFLEIANYLAAYNIQLFAFGNNTPTGTELNQIDVLFKRRN